MDGCSDSESCGGNGVNVISIGISSTWPLDALKNTEKQSEKLYTLNRLYGLVSQTGLSQILETCLRKNNKTKNGIF